MQLNRPRATLISLASKISKIPVEKLAHLHDEELKDIIVAPFETLARNGIKFSEAELRDTLKAKTVN